MKTLISRIVINQIYTFQIHLAVESLSKIIKSLKGMFEIIQKIILRTSSLDRKFMYRVSHLSTANVAIKIICAEKANKKEFSVFY